MIFQELTEKLRGYLSKEHDGAVAPFFPCVNMAVRRDALADIGAFDETLKTGEDIDFCIRALDSRWELFYNPDVRVEHAARPTVRALMKQWFDYGLYHSKLFVKHNGAAIEILLPSARKEQRSYVVVYYRDGQPGDARMLVFITSFAILHAAAGSALVAGALGLPLVAGAAGIVAALAARAYFAEDFARDAPLAQRVSFAGLRYLMNLALLGGGMLGGIRDRFLYVTAVVSRRV